MWTVSQLASTPPCKKMVCDQLQPLLLPPLLHQQGRQSAQRRREVEATLVPAHGDGGHCSICLEPVFRDAEAAAAYAASVAEQLAAVATESASTERPAAAEVMGPDHAVEADLEAPPLPPRKPVAAGSPQVELFDLGRFVSVRMQCGHEYHRCVQWRCTAAKRVSGLRKRLAFGRSSRSQRACCCWRVGRAC